MRMRRGERLHPKAVRVMHWTNAVAMIVMIWSGWGIYDDSVIFNFLHFPRRIVLGNGAANSLLWHFGGMWLLILNGTAYIIYGLSTGRFRERFLPIRLSSVVQTVRQTLKLKLEHEDLLTYNAVQKLLYIGVILAGIMQAATGLLLWQAVQLSPVMTLLGGFQSVRFLHFAGMAAIVFFLLVHVSLAIIVPRTLWFMLGGGPHVDERQAGLQ